MEGLGATASVIAVIDLAGKVATVLFQYLTAVKHAKTEIERLCEELDRLSATLQSAQRLLDGPNGDQLRTANSQALRRGLNGSYAELVSLEGRLRKKLDSGSSRVMSKFGIRSLKWPFDSKDVDRVIAALERQRDTLSAALTIDQVKQILDINQTLLLSKLSIVEDALFDSQANEDEPRCHPDTRVDLLREIYDWVDDTNSKSVFYLQGMAGTGKSTISRTVAQHLVERADRPLVATFFFKRGEGDRGNASRVITTLTSQLVAREPVLAASVKRAIDANHAITSKPMGEQFEQLILTPLESLKSDKPRTVVVVIDALDECGKEDDVRRLIYQISRGANMKSDTIRWRAFLTGRPELPVRLGIDVIRGNVEQRQLELIPESDIHHDLTSFFKARFASIRDDFNSLCHADSQLAQDWPGHEASQQLVQMAIPLFIFAATVCRFIGHRAWSDPQAQLEKILQQATAFSEMDSLEATYVPILRQLAVSSNAAQQRLRDEFHAVVGTIVTLAEPLSANSLSRVLGLPRQTIDRRLMSLHSVLRVPSSPDVPIKMLHLSFRDFLVDPEKRDKNPFWIDERAAHAKLADSCLDFLSSQDRLKKDICRLGSPGVSRADIPATVISSCLPADVRYACLYWVHHTEQSGVRLRDDHKVYNFLTKHLLHWLEALSLLGSLSESIYMIRGLRDLIADSASTRISAFLYDVFRFILAFRSIIDQCPLQAYSSALVFAPERSLVRRAFHHHMSEWLTMVPSADALDWTALVQTLEAEGRPRTLVFSPNGATIASSSSNTIQLWDSTTGDVQLEIQLSHIESFAFSPDSKLLASVSSPTITFWDAATGERLQDIKTIPPINTRVAFSPDSQRLVFCSHRGLHLLKVSTGEGDLLGEGYESNVEDLVFLPDGERVLILQKYADLPSSVSLLDTTTGKQGRLRCGQGEPHQVALSPTGTTVAWGGLDGTISLQDTLTNTISHELANPCLPVEEMAFSPDGKLLGSIDNDDNFHIWNIMTGERLFAYSDRNISIIALSPNGRLIGKVSKFNHLAVDLWDTKIRPVDPEEDTSDMNLTADKHGPDYVVKHQQKQGHTRSVKTIIFSPDGKTVASAASDNCVCIWDPKTSEESRQVRHEAPVHKIIYSADSKSIISLSGDNTILFLNTFSTGSRQLPHKGQEVIDIAVSPNGQTLASIGCDIIRLWNLPGAQSLQEFGHDSLVDAAEFSPDSKILATASRTAIHVWDVATGKERWRVDFVYAGVDTFLSVWAFLTFSLDSTSLSTVNLLLPEDQSLGCPFQVNVWDVETGRKHELPHDPTASYRNVALSADGKTVAANTFDHGPVFILTSTGGRELETLGRFESMSFSADDDRYLETNRGRLRIDSQEPPHTSPFVASDWVWQDGDHKLFWIPHSHRDFVCARYGSTFVLGFESGGMMFMRLD
ncbi:hypothetical protein BJY00DRAFT_110197 [Aspergillus carlsbadensis]|nr:hypothetical protein BJY00DRAFT_110197 [Aspergillus carlsbadensis]